MKIILINCYRHILFLISITLLLCSAMSCIAEETTNKVFKTTPRMWNSAYIDSENATTQMADILHYGVASKYGNELLTATEDIEGNWGNITNGIQLSIRFYQTNFTNGEPVSTVLLWRNASEGPRSIYFGWETENYPFDFVLRRDGNPERPLHPRYVPNWKDIRAGGGPSPQAIDSRNQMRFVLRLDKIYDLKPGAYEVSAKRDNAESGTAKFWVFPKAETQTNNPAGLK